MSMLQMIGMASAMSSASGGDSGGGGGGTGPNTKAQPVQMPTSNAPGAGNPDPPMGSNMQSRGIPQVQPAAAPTGFQGAGNIPIGNLGTSTRATRAAGTQNSQDQISQAIAQLQQMMQQSKMVQPRPTPVLPGPTGY